MPPRTTFSRTSGISASGPPDDLVKLKGVDPVWAAKELPAGLLMGFVGGFLSLLLGRRRS